MTLGNACRAWLSSAIAEHAGGSLLLTRLDGEPGPPHVEREREARRALIERLRAAADDAVAIGVDPEPARAFVRRLDPQYLRSGRDISPEVVEDCARRVDDLQAELDGNGDAARRLAEHLTGPQLDIVRLVGARGHVGRSAIGSELDHKERTVTAALTELKAKRVLGQRGGKTGKRTSYFLLPFGAGVLRQLVAQGKASIGRNAKGEAPTSAPCAETPEAIDPGEQIRQARKRGGQEAAEQVARQEALEAILRHRRKLAGL